MRSLFRSTLFNLIIILNFFFSGIAYSDNHNIYEILDLIKKAYDFSKSKHAGQFRDDGKDYSKLKEAMENLDKESYEILFLKYFKRMSEKEIAFILNIPEGTVKSRIFNAKEKLRKVIKNG
jgi:RNA polymerase sigma factor (sigma-70 family)